VAILARLADSNEDEHRLGQDPSRYKPENLRRRCIEPLPIVDDAEERTILRDLSQQAERCQGNQEAIRRIAHYQAERETKRVLLRTRNAVDIGKHRRAELVKSSERELHLGLDAGDPGNSKVRSLRYEMIEERGLTYPGLTAYDQHSALAGANSAEQPIQLVAFCGPTAEYRRVLEDHRLSSVGPSSVEEPPGGLPGSDWEGCPTSDRALLGARLAATIFLIRRPSARKADEALRMAVPSRTAFQQSAQFESPKPAARSYPAASSQQRRPHRAPPTPRLCQHEQDPVAVPGGEGRPFPGSLVKDQGFNQGDPWDN
jgi:hypothetical protein